MLRKILKWTVLTVLLIVMGVAIATAFRQHLIYDAPYPKIKASTDLNIIEKGKHIVLVTKACVQCHGSEDNVAAMLDRGEEPSLSGGRKIDTPFGIFFIPNITPDLTTGIGKQSDAEIARLLRYGVKSNGEAVLPFMQGMDMSDEEMTAVISYLRSLDPVNNKLPENEFSLIGKFAKAFVIKPSVPETAAASLAKPQ